MGHPKAERMQKMLKAGGAPDEVIPLVEKIRCKSCDEQQEPGSH